MKIKGEILSKFLDKISLGTKECIHECVLDFTNEGVKVQATTAASTTMVNGWLKKAAFNEYEAIGKVGINELEVFVDIIKDFKDILTLKVEGNLMTISMTGKKVDIETIDTTFITVNTNEPNLEFKETFTFPAEKLNEIIKSINKVQKDWVINFKTEAKLLKIFSNGKYKFNFEFVVPQCVGGVDVRFGEPFVDAFSKITGDVMFNLKSDYPTKILENNEKENYVISYICAPRVENTE
jgi:hypothetical protein